MSPGSSTTFWASRRLSASRSIHRSADCAWDRTRSRSSLSGKCFRAAATQAENIGRGVALFVPRSQCLQRFAEREVALSSACQESSAKSSGCLSTGRWPPRATQDFRAELLPTREIEHLVKTEVRVAPATGDIVEGERPVFAERKSRCSAWVRRADPWTMPWPFAWPSCNRLR